jgi:hypothetical protein
VQRAFTAEDEEVNQPVVLPEPAFFALARDDGSRVYGDDGNTPLKPERGWYSAARLSNPAAGVELYMVEARNPLRGGNVCRFWMVQYDTHSNTATILWSLPTHSVNLHYRSASRYPEMSTLGASAVHIWESTFRYSAGKYVVIRQSDYDIGSRGHR